ncbi:uncharacterized protein LOC144710359 [Wolffia australiana]
MISNFPAYLVAFLQTHTTCRAPIGAFSPVQIATHGGEERSRSLVVRTETEDWARVYPDVRVEFQSAFGGTLWGPLVAALLFGVLIKLPLRKSCRGAHLAVLGPVSRFRTWPVPFPEILPSAEIMSENGCTKCADQESFFGDQFSTATHGWNNVSYKLAEVKESETLFTSEVEMINFEPSTADTSYARGTREDVNCLSSTEMDKYLALEDFPYSDELCCFKDDAGISTIEAVQDEKQDLRHHDDQSLLLTGHVSDPCHNYISDDGFAERVPHNEFRYLMENLRSDVFGENFEQDGDFFWNINSQNTSILEKESLKQHRLVGLSSLIEMDNKSEDLTKPLSVYDSTDGALVLSESKLGPSDADCGEMAQKRRRKPTKRYIEETSEAECNSYIKGIGYSVHQEKILHQLRDHNVLCHSRRGRPKKNLSHTLVKDALGSRPVPRSWISSESENEDFEPGSSPAERDGGKCVARRKHHRLWTLAEVMKLIEGVSKCGVGRWTKIKRLLFSSSGYRTSVDLKDKWRNLLRASGAHVPGHKKEIESKRKSQSGMVPQSVLRRVRDLAAIHPYPRERSSRDSPRPPLSWNSP